MSNDKVCYPVSHVPFYVIAIVFVTLIFFMTFWQSNEQKYFQYHHNVHHNKYEPFQPMQTNTGTVTVGHHNSAHGSAIHATPFNSSSAIQSIPNYYLESGIPNTLFESMYPNGGSMRHPITELVNKLPGAQLPSPH